ncbi:MAG: zf-HC2 domain-containing protein [Vicinamibacterales bacterium]
MSCSRYHETIHELADGTLGPVRRAELQTHLDVCDACRALVADLRKIREGAAALPPVQPRDHVWMQIAGRLRQEGRVTGTRDTDSPSARPRYMAMLAIAATLMLAVAASLYFLRGTEPTERPAQATAAVTPGAGNAATTDTVQSITDDLMLAEQHYQSAITKLQEVAKTDDGAIDPETAAVLEKNLQVIDQAIAESRTALKTEPQSVPARDSLFEALRQKVTLLQSTIALMNEMRKGNSAGAAQLVDGANKS